MRVKIVGNGVWGQAIQYVLQHNNTDVSIIKRGELIQDADVIALAVPTQSIREVLPLIKSPNIIVNTAKGIEKSTNRLPYQIVRDELGTDIYYYSLVGPSFAEEVCKNMPTLVNLGRIKKSSYDSRVRNLFQTDFFRVRLTDGVEVLELSAALKNIYAIGCGLVDGLGYTINTRVNLVVLAIDEMQNLFKNFHLSVDPDSTAGTVGDLILTCNSEGSRNFQFGKLLAAHSKEECLKIIGETVEGYYSLDSISYLEKMSNAKLPLASFIQSVVHIKDRDKIKNFFEDFVKNS